MHATSIRLASLTGTSMFMSATRTLRRDTASGLAADAGESMLPAPGSARVGGTPEVAQAARWSPKGSRLRPQRQAPRVDAADETTGPSQARLARHCQPRRKSAASPPATAPASRRASGSASNRSAAACARCRSKGSVSNRVLGVSKERFKFRCFHRIFGLFQWQEPILSVEVTCYGHRNQDHFATPNPRRFG